MDLIHEAIGGFRIVSRHENPDVCEIGLGQL